MIQKTSYLSLISFFILLASCEPGADIVPYNPPPLIDHYFVYKSNSKHSKMLLECTIKAKGSCPLNIIPFIGLENEYPSVKDIMNRLIVSRLWMGRRFEEFLSHYPKEALSLFRSVTAIVIGSNIRPSHYDPIGSIIYLDPKNLWLTKNEFYSVSQKKDSRDQLGDLLSFDFLRRPLKHNKLAYNSHALQYIQDRSMQDIVFVLSSVLFHELAHAVDYFHYTTLNYNRTIPFAALPFAAKQSSILHKNYTDFPLTSTNVYALAVKKYLVPATQRDTTSPTKIATNFFMDKASDLYSHTNKHEDFAMLFEAIASKKFFNVEYEIAFTNNPIHSNNCASYIIAQGRRNRIANPSVKKRALLVAKNVLPSIDWDTFFSTKLGKETQLNQGKNWCLN